MDGLSAHIFSMSDLEDCYRATLAINKIDNDQCIRQAFPGPAVLGKSLNSPNDALTISLGTDVKMTQAITVSTDHKFHARNACPPSDPYYSRFAFAGT